MPLFTEAFRIFEESSKILALYYDGRDFSRIGAWHHAAGDFIVKARDDEGINVRLTTVRKYEPLPETENAAPMIALVYFFLDTTVRMRLDRLNGVGETVWADDFAVTATVKGFIEGLRAREIKGNAVAGSGRWTFFPCCNPSTNRNSARFSSRCWPITRHGVQMTWAP